jgi:hypothetical protein
MAVLYCFGIPATSWVALNSKREQIQKLQLLTESIEELEKGGTSTSNKGLIAGQRKKSVMHQDLVANATRRFSGVGVELDGTAGSILKAKLLKLEASMKENDPWLAGLSPLYKDYDSLHWWFEVFHAYFQPPASFFVTIWSLQVSSPLLSAGPQIYCHFDFVWPCDLDSCGRSVASFYFTYNLNGHDGAVCKQWSVLEQKRRCLGTVLSVLADIRPDHRAS